MGVTSDRWRRQPNWVHVGQVLLERGIPMSAGEIAAALHKDHSNMRDTARAMARAGLLEERPCVRRQVGPGRTPAVEFALRATEVSALKRLLETLAEPGVLRAGQQLVFADGSALADMAEALAEAGFQARGSWAAICDGEPQEYVMVFDGPDAVRAAVDLMSMLRAAQVHSRRVGLATLMTAGEFTGWAHDTRRRAERLQGGRPVR